MVDNTLYVLLHADASYVLIPWGEDNENSTLVFPIFCPTHLFAQLILICILSLY